MSSSPQSKKSQKELGRVVDLLRRSGIDPDDIESVHKLKLYQAMAVIDGEPVVVDLASATVTPAQAETPETQFIRRAPAARIVRPLKTVKGATDGTTTTVILPDPQIGYRRQGTTLVPIHDTAAIDVAMQLIRHLRPAAVVNLGDTIDAAELGKYQHDPESQYVTQHAIDSAHEFFARQRANAGDDAAITVIEGNHDRRLETLVERHVPAILRLARAGSTAAVLSIPYLLRLDELGVDYIGGYPAGQTVVAPGDGRSCLPLIAVHGRYLTSAKHAAAHPATSVVHGHTHRIEDYRATTPSAEPGVAVHQSAFSPGCLCRVDGLVPGVRSSTSRGRAEPYAEGWQQGVAIVTTQPDGSWTHELIEIRAGVAVCRGKRYVASDAAYAALDGLPEAA